MSDNASLAAGPGDIYLTASDRGIPLLGSTELVEKYQPHHDYVLVEELPEGETAGGIVMPETREGGLRMGVIHKVGPGKISDYEGTRIPMESKVGDVVLLVFPSDERISIGAPTQLPRCGGKEFCLIREKYLLGTVGRVDRKLFS